MNILVRARNSLADARRLSSSSFGCRFLKGASWVMAGSLVARSFGVATTLVVARVLGKEGFGQLAVIHSTSDTFTTLAGLGLGVAATRYVAEYRTSDPLRAGRIISLSMVFAMAIGGAIASLLLFVAPWLCTQMLAAPELTPLVRISSLTVMFTAISGTQIGILNGFEGFRTLAIRNLIVGFLQFPMTLAGVFMAGLQGAVWALACGAGLQCLVNHLAMRSEARKVEVPIGSRGWLREIGVVWHFSVPAMLAGIMVMPVAWICNVLLVNQESGYAQMGIYQAANSFQGILTFLASTAGAPLIPILASLAGNQSERVNRFNILFTWVLGVALALPLICFPEVAQMLYGPQYAGTSFVQTFVFIMLFTCIIYYKQGLTRVLFLRDLVWWGVLSNIVWAVVLLISAYILVPKGAPGLAIAYVLAYSVSTVVFIPFYSKLDSVPPRTLISIEAVLIWSALIGAVLISTLDTPPFWRGAYFLFALLITGISFSRLSLGTKSTV